MNTEVPLVIQLIQSLSRDIANDSLALPSLPDLATHLQELRATDDLAPRRLADAILGDIATSARLVQIANSAANRRGQTVESVGQAVARLGTEASLNIALSFALEQMFSARSPAIDLYLHQTWRHGRETAAAARVLAEQNTLLNPELAMLAGLLHGIGKLPLLRIVDDRPEIAQDRDALDRLLSSLHPAAGCRVLRAWQLPAAIVDVPADCLDFARSHPGPADYADVVAVALVLGEGLKALADNLDRTAIPAFAKLDIDPRADASSVLDAEALRNSRELVGAV
ncbi:MAG: HDOD domain-containing protein [Nevskiaceae bacterium]|nr:MAG: HDOD domain-containing protein [Nevskiaceae bacterium]TBR73021.1 MAG: HDOD domain-containing protein [Nevskiaceae bacterium]